MPRQEDRVLERIRLLKETIQDAGKIALDELDAWGLINLGVRPRTIGLYVSSLAQMGVVLYDAKTKEVVWNE